LWVIAIVAAFVAIYVLFLRAWLKAQPWAQGFFAAVEPVEIWLWNKSETILWARFKGLCAFLLALLPQIGAIDVTPYVAFIPEKHRWWVMLVPSAALALDGVMSELLRRSTTKPLEVVQLPEDVPPDVARAIENADAAKAEAVAVITEAKAEGQV
jgi:hypothetical protein